MIVNHLSLLVTTRCSRACPDCCFQIPTHATLPAWSASWGYLEAAAKIFRDVDWLYVAGGEPTLHPEFDRIAREFRALFDPERLLLTTNGAKVIEHGDVMDRFDEIRVTDFGDDASRAAIAWLRAHHPDRLAVADATHVPMSRRPGAWPCDRNQIAAYALGKLWPCCEGPGLADAPFVVPGPDWRRELEHAALPCRRCPFALATEHGR